MENTESRPVGRPKKTLADLPQNWRDIILDLKREGASNVECKVAIGVSNDLWERLIKEEPEFSDAVKEGELLCETWWLKAGRTGMFQTSGGKEVHTNLNPALWYMNMKNRFGWADKQEVKQDTNVSFTPSSIEEIKRKMLE